MTIPEKNLMLFRNKVRKLDIPVLYREKRILYDLEVTKKKFRNCMKKWSSLHHLAKEIRNLYFYPES